MLFCQHPRVVLLLNYFWSTAEGSDQRLLWHHHCQYQANFYQNPRLQLTSDTIVADGITSLQWKRVASGAAVWNDTDYVECPDGAPHTDAQG